MFLNKTQLKKMIKSSFNHEGLFVGKVYGGLVVAGGTWITWTHDGYIPNWIKAAVMEYTGELPGVGHAFKAKKDEPIQYEVADNEIYNLPQMAITSPCGYVVTPMIVRDRYNSVRLLQRIADKELRPLAEGYYDVIDLSELENENAPVGPMAANEISGLILWKNEFSAYACMMLSDTAENTGDIMNAVRHIDFSREGK